MGSYQLEPCRLGGTENQRTGEPGLFLARVLFMAQAPEILCRVGLVVALLVPGLARAGGLEPTALPSIDPNQVAQLTIKDQTPGAGERFYAQGGRFAGDLDGDGTDDIVLQAGVDNALEIFFGSTDLGEGDVLERGGAGDTQLVLPDGCRLEEQSIRYAGLGDVDGDGYDDLGVACPEATDTDGEDSYEGLLVLYYGREQPWGAVVATPDGSVRATPVQSDDEGPVSGTRAGERLAPLGDLDEDGFDDFFVSGLTIEEPDQPVAWIFHGSSQIRALLTDVTAATWAIEGRSDLRCLQPLTATAVGDVDADGTEDIAIGCPEQPPLFPPQDANALNLALSVFLGDSLDQSGAGPLFLFDRDFGVDSLSEVVPTVVPFARLGNLDGIAGDEFAIVSQFGELLQGRIVQGQAGPRSDLTLVDAHVSFQLSGGYDSTDGLQLAPAGNQRGLGEGVWLRFGEGDESKVGLLESFDPSTWLDMGIPPVVVTFSTPGQADVDPAGRLGLGGPGDADGDGINDLLILSGFEDGTGCEADECGGAWLILCGDLDGDGLSACGGDCDDRDATVSPRAPELCDDTDHDCNGDSGQADEDEDGFAACDGDCDDEDETRFPGAEESCGDGIDLDCDGLAPDDDQDGDSSPNCEDCQPWAPGVFPGAEEICDGFDTDCDFVLPEVEQDIDQDGWRACALSGTLLDCDDRNPFIHPHRFADCTDGIDNNCDDTVDEDEDEDEDGVSTCNGDCDDTDASLFPGAPEVCDGLDNNCDGVPDNPRDLDDDGFSPCDGDCADGDPEHYPGAVGVCSTTEDGNCDGLDDLSDNDGDGYTACSGDCDDADAGVSPRAHDYCDRRDEDCDGVVDQDWDVDLDGWAYCHGDCDDGQGDRFPQPTEPLCDDLEDGDCDGDRDPNDADCPQPEPPPPPGPRPYGLACSDCESSLAAEHPTARLGLWGALLLWGVRRRRRTFRPRSPGRLALRAGDIPQPLWVLWVPVLAFLLSSPSAQAARKEPAVIVYLAPQPDLRHMTEAQDKLPKVIGEEVLHSSEVFTPEELPVSIVGAKTTWSCPEDRESPRLGAARDRAIDRLIELDPRGARDELGSAIDFLPCVTSTVTNRTLGDLYYYRGAASLQLGDVGRADDDFARAAAVRPEYQGDPNLPPEVNEVFLAAKARKDQEEPALVYVYAPPGLDARLDGRALDAAEGGVAIAPGVHLVQFTRDQNTDSLLFEVSLGGNAVALLRDDVDLALAEAPDDESARAFAQQVLGLAAADAGVDLVAVVDLFDGEAGYFYRGGTDSFSFDGDRPTQGSRVASVEESSADQRSGSSRQLVVTPTRGSGINQQRLTTRPTSGASGGGSMRVRPSQTRPAANNRARASSRITDDSRVRIRLSGGYAYVHPWSYVHIPLDVGVRLWEGLHLDAGFDLSTPGPSSDELIWLPAGTLGLSYRIPLGPVEPRFGAVGRIAVDRQAAAESRPLGGWAIRVGLDLTLPGTGPFLLGFDVQGGMLGKPFYLSASLGAGVRL